MGKDCCGVLDYSPLGKGEGHRPGLLLVSQGTCTPVSVVVELICRSVEEVPVVCFLAGIHCLFS